jgi:diguanylate cyclase (GGDEF)-like protein
LIGNIAFNSTELLLLMTAVQMVMFALAWAAAALELEIDRPTLRAFLLFNVMCAFALAAIATRDDAPDAIARALPNVLILTGMLALARGLHAYWGLRLDRASIGVTLAAIALVIWFGMIDRDDKLRVTTLLAGFLWLLVVCMTRTYQPTRHEFGFAAANTLTLIAIIVLITMSWRIYFVAFTDFSADLNRSSRFSELGVFVLMLAANGPNLLYGYFVCVRLVRSANRAANSDGLTHLLNHRAFMQESERAWNERRERRVQGCVLAIDIDHFKRVNDQHGHQAGDRVLQMFASLLRATFAKDCVVGRTGGEEFIVVLARSTKEEATQLAERLMRLVARAPWRGRDGTKIDLTISIGIAFDAPRDLRPNDLLLRADKALYAAKQAGRNRIEFD